MKHFRRKVMPCLASFCIFAVGCKPRGPESEVAASSPQIKFDPLKTGLNDPLNGFGFEPKSAEGKKGMNHIFNGDGFYLYIPYQFMALAKTIDRRSINIIDFSEETGLDYQWKVYGNPPSPPQRGRVGDPDGAGSKYNPGTGYSIFSKGKDVYINFNCFQCHAGALHGTVYSGLGNAFTDQYAQNMGLELFSLAAGARDKVVENQYFKAISKIVDVNKFVNRAAGLSAHNLESLKYFRLYSETILQPALNGAEAKGDNLGPFPVWMLMARMQNPKGNGFDLIDREIVGSKRPKDLAERENLVTGYIIPTVDPLPWWLRKYRLKSYWYLDSVADGSAGKDFAINFTIPHAGHNESYKKRAAEITSILTYAHEIPAPPFPTVLPKAGIEKGHKTYSANCAGCHGELQRRAEESRDGLPLYKLLYKTKEFRDKNDQPKMVADSVTYQKRPGTLAEVLHDVGTDPNYNMALQRYIPLTEYVSGLIPHLEKLKNNRPNVFPAVYNPKESGYTAPPLISIWASAPYLHNGSVPTLRDLFKPEGERPRYWQRTLNIRTYDYQNVGLTHQVLNEMPKAPDVHFYEDEAVKHRLIYQATKPGKWNGGAETCGSRIDAEDQEDLLTLLKYLSDESVIPD